MGTRSCPLSNDAAEEYHEGWDTVNNALSRAHFALPRVCGGNIPDSRSRNDIGSLVLKIKIRRFPS